MKRLNARSGFILPMALILALVAGIIVASVGAYVAQAARTTRYHLAKDRCRFAAQSAIENAKCEIQRGFINYIAANFASIQIAPGKAKAYNWFDTVSADRRTIGSSNPATIFAGIDYPVSCNGCDVWVGIGENVEHENNAAVAVVPVIATAVFQYPDGLRATATIEERIVFGTGQSKVFDNAYFVNNYGWMNGGFVINGEFRANGNVSLKGGCTVNGFVYAAPNSEIGAAGTVTVQSANIYNRSKYRSTVGTRARYDTGNVDDIGSYDPATTTSTIAKPTFYADGSLRSGTKTSDNVPIVNERSDPVEMPFVSELQPYIEYAQDEGGTLRYPAVTYTDVAGNAHTVPAGQVNAYNSTAQAGPSGDASLADAGSLLLVGTQSNPIEIDGPVVVAGDVVIKGYVKGQGTIYAGRNVHVIGDIAYVDAPTWTHTKTGDAALEEQKSNDSKSMLGIVAKGNIVVGDCTSSTIAANVNSGTDIAYACDVNDSSIGYPSTSFSTTKTVYGRPTTSNTFNGDYTAVEQINSLSSELSSTAPGGYQASSGKFGKVRSTSQTEYYYDQYGTRRSRKVANASTSYDRHYYETIIDDAVINSLKRTVSRIDAVMYNNHGVFGKLGASFQINGALVCRDEGLTANGGSFNWDMRLRRKKDSEVVAKMGLPKGAGDPYTASWMEIPDSSNPVYPNPEEGYGD